MDPKDGYPISECLVTLKKRVLEFLIPILYLEKPTRVTMIVGNTIFGSLSDDCLVDWGKVIREVVGKSNLGSSGEK